jgi:hypothetical protein
LIAAHLRLSITIAVIIPAWVIASLSPDSVIKVVKAPKICYNFLELKTSHGL